MFNEWKRRRRGKENKTSDRNQFQWVASSQANDGKLLHHSPLHFILLIMTLHGTEYFWLAQVICLVVSPPNLLHTSSQFSEGSLILHKHCSAIDEHIISVIFVTNLKHRTIWTVMKKINSIPVTPSTQTNIILQYVVGLLLKYQNYTNCDWAFIIILINWFSD